MLTNSKRNKIIAGVAAIAMLGSIASCASEKDQASAEWDNGNDYAYQQNNSGFFSPLTSFFMGTFIGRMFGFGSVAVPPAPAPAPVPANAGSKTDNNGAMKQDAVTKSDAPKAKIGSVGEKGKSGIGSSMKRSSGSAIS